ncbi:hypothetical protein [Fodinicola acaciae]|uniref:hypothetical protein n=1 Tax=Fodinicola acaciae TaxID=2681555 RepID=UPI0013D6B8E9|nr:hypothetical protein [Fodinicola acaciae]
MIDEIFLAVATAIATQTGSSLATAATGGVTSLVRLVRAKLAARHDVEPLDNALEPGAGDDQVNDLANAINSAAAEDQRFATELRAAWTQYQTQINAHDHAIVNNYAPGVENVTNISGDVGTLNIGRDRQR